MAPNKINGVCSVGVSEKGVTIHLMKYIVLFLAMFSLASVPAMASEPCGTGMEMPATSQADMSANASDMSDCCDMSGQVPGDMPDNCAMICALGCANLSNTITPPDGEDGYHAAIMIHLLPESKTLRSQAVSFEPPPPRI